MARTKKTEREKRKDAARFAAAAANVDSVVVETRSSGPTAETRAKFRMPIVARLLDTGRIGGDELRAVQEIELVFEKVSRGMRAKSMTLDRVDGQRGSEPERFIDAYWERYRPWADEWSKRRNRLGDRTLEAVYDCLFGMETGRELDSRYGVRHGTVVTMFVTGIRDYCARAGWVEPRLSAAWRAPSTMLAA